MMEEISVQDCWTWSEPKHKTAKSVLYDLRTVTKNVRNLSMFQYKYLMEYLFNFVVLFG